MNLLKDLRQRLFGGWSGCSDHNCIVTGKKTGMGTNGGCHCLRDASRSYLNILASRLQSVITEAEKERTGDKEEIFLRLAKVASEYDVAEDLLWSPDLFVSITCNDVFSWACADGEEVKTHEDIDLFVQACKEAHYQGPLLYCARKRGMRPQGAMYKHIDKKYHHLFDAVGPERDPSEPGNTPKPK